MPTFLTRLKNKYTHEEDHCGREIIVSWLKSHGAENARVLDVGCGDGTDLLSLKAGVPSVHLYGVDIMQACVDECESKGIRALVLNLEHQEIPFDAEYFDIVIANQVFEHLKGWVWALWQIGLKLKSGGILVVGVPNLASLHNRVLLFIGEQPTCINPAGMHVRGFTVPGLRRVLEYKGAFKVERVAGQPFYPFPRSISKVLSRLFPEAAAEIFLLCRKTGDSNVLAEIQSVGRREEFRLL